MIIHDDSEIKFIKSVNGFNIYYSKDDDYKYVVMHPSFKRIWIDSFLSLEDAEDFCLEEYSEEWFQTLKEDVEWVR